MSHTKNLLLIATFMFSCALISACSPPKVPSSVPAVSSAQALEVPSADSREAAAIVAVPQPIHVEPLKAAPVAKAKAKNLTKARAKVDATPRITRAQCNAELASQMLSAVDTKIDFDIEFHTIRDFGSIVTHPSVVAFKAKCDSLAP